MSLNGSALDISRNHEGVDNKNPKGSFMAGKSSDGEQQDGSKKNRNTKKRIVNGTQNIDKLEKM